MSEGDALRARASEIVLQLRGREAPLGRRAIEAQARNEAAVKRREARRLLRELYPPAPLRPPSLTFDDQLEAIRVAAAARKAGDARPSNDLVREAADRVREARKPRER